MPGEATKLSTPHTPRAKTYQTLHELDRPIKYTFTGQRVYTYNFSVRDTLTGEPVKGAQVFIFSEPNGNGVANSNITDSMGIAGLDAKGFTPRSWSVSKAQYQNVYGNEVMANREVSLTPLVTRYKVGIFADHGGFTSPSNSLIVDPNHVLTVRATPHKGYVLDRWVYKGMHLDNQPTKSFKIDRDNTSIHAVFKNVQAHGHDAKPENLYDLMYRGQRIG